jgi:GNAT superfamily N-acetyltransferase
MSTVPTGFPQVAPVRSRAIRRASAGDLPRIIAAADETFRTPTPPGLGSMGHDYPLLFAPENAANLFILEDDRGDVVAHAGFVLREASLARTRVRVATIGAVFTRPDQRQNGLGSQVLSAAVSSARQAGADLGLVSGARTLYERAGFSPYPPCPRYRVPAAAADGGAAEVVAYTPTALPEVMALYAAEPAHFVRSVADWQEVLAAGVLFFEPSRMFLLQRNRRTVAYLAVGSPGLGRDEAPGDPRGARALELAGDRDEIAAAAPWVARALALDALDLVLPPGDESLSRWASQRGWMADEVRMPFTTTWWNPALRDLPLPFYGFNYV